MRGAVLGVAILAASACGGETPPASDTTTTVTPQADSGAAVPGVAAIGADSADSAGRRARGGTAATKVPARDSAFGPKFTTDSTGKLVPIKPP